MEKTKNYKTRTKKVREATNANEYTLLQSGAVPPVNILQLGPKNVKLMRPIVNGYVSERADLEKYTAELFDLVISKKVEVKIHNIYSLKDAAQAHIDLESRKTTGKLLLKID